MDRRRPLDVNKYEALTDSILQSVVQDYGARVCPKVRAADTLLIEHSDISKDEYSYALKAHFDFVVTDESTRACFAVEFDEKHHLTDPRAIRNDRLKTSICEQLNFPLLRIGSQGLRYINGYYVLGWLARLYFAHQAFLRQQAAGEIPATAEFDWRGLFLKNANGELTPANPFSEYYDVIRKAYNEAILVDPEPIIVGIPEPHLYFDSYAAVRLTGGGSLVAIARCRMFSIFASLAPWELAERFAVVSLVGKLERYKVGTYKLSKEDDYDRMIRQVAEKATRPPRIKSL